MANAKQLFMKLAKEDSGQDLIEYALVAAISGLDNSLKNSFNAIGSGLASSTA
jgi:Flp pilus assembly pilin Flp